jgi:hypothetical protein
VWLLLLISAPFLPLVRTAVHGERDKAQMALKVLRVLVTVLGGTILAALPLLLRR